MTEYKDFSNYKFHPSSLGLIMTGSKDKNDPLGETCKAHLLECWIEETYGRKKDFTNKYMEKGTLVEEDSITLYSVVTKKFHKKNTETVSNDYLIGTPDLFDGETIMTATVIKDIKSSWDIFTFYQTMTKPMNKIYEWQLDGYMGITGAKEAGLAYCLVNTPTHLINDAKRKLAWNMNVIDPESSPEYLLQAAQIERNMIFDDIPMADRLIEFGRELEQDRLSQAYEKIGHCRRFMNSLNKKAK